MISKNQIRNVTSLHQKKFRREEGMFIAEGEKLVRDLLRSKWTLITLFGTQKYFQDLGKDVRIPKATEVVLVTDDELKKISALITPQKVLAVVRMPESEDEVNYEGGLKLVLDNINDPGNLGTIIRIADWFGIREIICSNETVDCYNPKVVQGTMGSLFSVKIVYKALEDIFESNLVNKNLPVFGMVLDGQSIYHRSFPPDAFILVGSESSGLQPDLLKYITDRVTIPSHDSVADSLNVAIATGIICSEFRRC